MAVTACQVCRPFRVPRRDHALDECEDACALDVSRGRFAIADGAAESAQSGLWARLLVEEFVAADETGQPWPTWIEPLQRQWADATRIPDVQALPWFLEGRYRDGAFATFLGLTIDATRWQALAVGDSCLFQIRAGQLLLAFPLTHSSQFNSAPWLIGSRTPPDEIPARQALHLAGEWQPGDRFLLMTDALSRWFLSSTESGGNPWLAIEQMLQQGDAVFSDWIDRLRNERVLKNDDTTLVVVCL
jgi:hypothetical protein